MTHLTPIRSAIGIWALLLIIGGTITNILVALTIVFRKKLRSVPTFVFTAFTVIMETIPLYSTNLNFFYSAYFGASLDAVSDYFCRFNQFLNYFSIESSAWLLIAMTVERLLSVRFKSWRMGMFNSRKAVFVSIGIILFFIILTFRLAFSQHQVTSYANNRTVTVCVPDSVVVFWYTLDLYLYSVVPFIVLAITNSFLIYYGVVKRASNIKISNADKSKRRGLTISVVAFTLAFVLFTSPIAIMGGYFLAYFRSTEGGVVSLIFMSAVRTTLHTINLFVLLVSNKAFRNEFKGFLRIGTPNQVGNTSMRTSMFTK